MRRRHLLLLCVIPIVLAGCSPHGRSSLTATTAPNTGPQPVSQHDEEPVGSPVLDLMNQRLAVSGANYRVVKAELVAVGRSGESNGTTLIADDGRLRPIIRYVPGDGRRNATGNSIRYLVDQSDIPNGVAIAHAEAAIDRAMSTWNATGKVPIVKVSDPGVDPDLADGLLGLGGMGTPHFGDIVHAGWLPPSFFDAIFPGAGNQILAVTFGFGFVPPTDIDGDRKFDVAFSEIYYNNHFTWGVDADPPTADVETVALHEAGHGLCLSHFGKIFMNTDSDGMPRLDEDGEVRLHFAPYAVMNSIIFGRHQVLEGSDNGQLSNLWGSWPKSE